MSFQIKFSHKYPKLSIGMDFYIERAKLLDVLPVELKSLSKDFLDYDTGEGMYKFGEGNVNMNILIFLSDQNILFTTIRPVSSTGFYRSGIGKMFDVLIKGRDYE